jgi:serine protease Do
VGVVRDGKRLEREVTLRPSPNRAPTALHPSSCSLAAADAAGRADDIIVTELPRDRAARLPGGAGVAISSVPADSAAAEAGLRVGDIILRIGKTSVHTGRETATAIASHKGTMIPLLVRRSGYDFWAALRRR